MSRSIQSRRDTRQGNRLVQVPAGRAFRGKAPSSGRRCHSAARLIGLPLSVSIAQLKGVRWRYCTRWDEGPAATLGLSLLRLGICQPNDWSGSAVDFVERGFNRFCHENGAPQAKKVWVGDLRIADTLFELTEQERNQVEAGREGATQQLFLTGDYEAAASIPIGATLSRLEAEHELLPAAFYRVFVANLYKWMRVYEYVDAQEHAEMWMEDLSDEELEARSTARSRQRSQVASESTPRGWDTRRHAGFYRRSNRPHNSPDC